MMMLTRGPTGTGIYLNGVQARSIMNKLEGETFTHGIYATRDHVVKHVDDEEDARKEVSAGRFMRKLGIHEVPQHYYGTLGPYHHFVITDRVHDAAPLAHSYHNIKSPPQRLIDMVAAERYIGAEDRHDYNYLVHSSGTVHPIDYGDAFNSNLWGATMPDSHPKALAARVLKDRVWKNKVSAEMHKVLRYHLPLLQVYINHHTPGDGAIKRFEKIREAVSQKTSPSVQDLT